MSRETLGALTNPQTEASGDREIFQTEQPSLDALYITRQTEEQKMALLERMVWIRREIESFLAEREITLVEIKGRMRFKLDRPIPQDLIPWFIGTRDVDATSVWGMAGKMGCPTFDLPAGGLLVGGSCPGADDAQGIVPAAQRASSMRQAPPAADGGAGERLPIDINKTICSYCYAFDGNYPTLEPQSGEIIRYWWTRNAVKDGSFPELIVQSMLLEDTWPCWDEVRDERDELFKYRGRTLMPVRIHSAGDFWGPEYAKAWIEAANILARRDETRGVRMWAPTRTWEAWGISRWKTLLDNLDTNNESDGPNLIVRASAYHVDDSAPGWLHPRNAMGSTSIWRDHNERRRWVTEGSKTFVDVDNSKSDPRFEYDCPIYTGEANTCADAKCRACWTKPKLRVNYETH